MTLFRINSLSRVSKKLSLSRQFACTARARDDETRNGHLNGNHNRKGKSSRSLFQTKRLERDLERSFKILISILTSILRLIFPGTGWTAQGSFQNTQGSFQNAQGSFQNTQGSF